MTARDNIDLDIQRAQIGKRDEVLVNPYPAKGEKEKEPYLMPPQNVNYHKYKRLEAPYYPRARDEPTGGGSGWWIVGIIVLGIIGAKLIGMW